VNSQIQPIVESVKNGKSTARQQVEEALKKIEANREYNAIISTIQDRALKRADEIDNKIKSGEEVGRLAGVPFIAKDNFLTFDSETTAASNILKGFRAPFQSTAIEKLEAEGAICVAKANLDSFAHGSSTENSDFGPVKNPVDKARVPGGSSGGSAVSVALGFVPFALGTDTGGSIRLPASFSGVVGLKPTYGRVSRYGVVAMASSTDVIGPLTKSVHDSALILDVMAGKDQFDSTTLFERPDTYLPDAKIPTLAAKLKIGLVKEYMSDEVDAGVKSRINEVALKFQSLGHSVEEVSLPSIQLSLPVYYIVVPAEISSNLARYDGIKFGLSATDANDLKDVYGLSRDRGFNAENKRRILIGNYVLSSGYYDAYYKKAQTVRTKLINEFDDAFKHYDVLLGPVAPTTAFKLGENTSDPLKMYLADIMTVSASLAGIPAISIPVGNIDGLPVGVQLIGQQASESELFALGSQIEGVFNG
jgi:aspartyl-tRNA(Asn)/glutamyl-tRNA(Gln) amidotransferase subunit A